MDSWLHPANQLAAAAATNVTNLIGGALALVLPYLFIALALRGRAVWSKGVGVAVATLMTWLTSFPVTEDVIALQRANPVRLSSIPYVLLTVVGVVVLAFGLRDMAGNQVQRVLDGDASRVQAGVPGARLLDAGVRR
jgi:hypothetical protein